MDLFINFLLGTSCPISNFDEISWTRYFAHNEKINQSVRRIKFFLFLLSKSSLKNFGIKMIINFQLNYRQIIIIFVKMESKNVWNKILSFKSSFLKKSGLNVWNYINFQIQFSRKQSLKRKNITFNFFILFLVLNTEDSNLILQYCKL